MKNLKALFNEQVGIGKELFNSAQKVGKELFAGFMIDHGLTAKAPISISIGLMAFSLTNLANGVASDLEMMVLVLETAALSASSYVHFNGVKTEIEGTQKMSAVKALVGLDGEIQDYYQGKHKVFFNHDDAPDNDAIVTQLNQHLGAVHQNDMYWIQSGEIPLTDTQKAILGGLHNG